MNARRFAAVLMFALACAAPLRTASAQNELGPTLSEIVKRDRLNAASLSRRASPNPMAPAAGAVSMSIFAGLSPPPFSTIRPKPPSSSCRRASACRR